MSVWLNENAMVCEREQAWDGLSNWWFRRHLNPCLATNHTRRTNCTHNPYCLFGFTVKPKVRQLAGTCGSGVMCRGGMRRAKGCGPRYTVHCLAAAALLVLLTGAPFQNKAPTDSHPPAIREHEHGRPTTLMGLNNQGATCYMNSLLQVALPTLLTSRVNSMQHDFYRCTLLLECLAMQQYAALELCWYRRC